MIIDTKPRDFSYINHKNNQPLQLTGHMKHRPRPQSSNPISKTQAMTFGTNSNKLLTDDQIINNYKDLKSVIPIDLSIGKRKQSIRTYNKQKNVNVSGAALLMIKSRIEKDHPEKRHVTDRNWYGYSDLQQNHKQKRHYQQNNSQSQKRQRQYSRKHSTTLNQRLSNDIYSRIQVKENIISNTVKMNNKSMFREGAELGYEQSKEHRLSCAKKRQLIGSAYQPQKSNKKIFRNDWRNSSFQLGW